MLTAERIPEDIQTKIIEIIKISEVQDCLKFRKINMRSSSDIKISNFINLGSIFFEKIANLESNMKFSFTWPSEMGKSENRKKNGESPNCKDKS